MALTNFSLPFGAGPWSPTVSPLHPIHQQLTGNTHNLLYSPADHQPQPDDAAPPPPNSDFYKNNPYAPPQQQTSTTYQYNNNNNNNGRRKNTYLPPIPPPGTRNTQSPQYHYQQQQQFQQHQQHQQQQQHFHQQQQQPQFSHINHNQPQQQEQQQLTQNNNVLPYKNAISSSSLSSTSSSSSAASVAAALTSSSSINTRTYGEGSYSRFPQGINNNNNIHKEQTQQQQQQQQELQFYNTFSSNKQLQQQQQQIQQTRINAGFTSSSSSSSSQQSLPLQPNYGPPAAKVDTPASSYIPAGPAVNKADSSNESSSNDPYPDRPPGFTRVQAGQGSRTGVHAVLDYDLEEGEEEDYYDAEDHGETVAKDGSHKSQMPTVTPIQGPIYLKNGTVPVVPLFHYPTFNNGSFVQIPIWWTALSVALGLDVSGDLIKGVPCVKRFHQLFCPTAGNSYPIDKIEQFIDDNKALMRRMYGDFEMNMDNGGPRQQTKKRKRRFIDDPDIFLPPGTFPSFVPDDKVEAHAEEEGESYFGKLRKKRQSKQGNNRNAKQAQGQSPTGRLDACESKIEIVTPYWASNSAGKIRAIVNTQHFEQAIHQEICSKSQTPRCQNDCGCEQKYKWHRLLAYEPDNDCKGIFMDWFLFPSCCVCRCNP